MKSMHSMNVDPTPVRPLTCISDVPRLYPAFHMLLIPLLCTIVKETGQGRLGTEATILAPRLLNSDHAEINSFLVFVAFVLINTVAQKYTKGVFEQPFCVVTNLLCVMMDDHPVQVTKQLYMVYDHPKLEPIDDHEVMAVITQSDCSL